MDEVAKVLVVDDEEQIRRNFKAYLEDLGYQVSVAEEGAEGLRIFAFEKPDIVLTDLRMAQMDGLRFIEELQKTSPDTPIVVVSGSGTLQDAVEAIRLGAWDYVIKPVHEAQELDTSIKRALQRARTIEEHRRRREDLEVQVAERTRQLQASLEEKEVLLRELYHRTKNNMQVICSLLYLQASYTTDEHVLRVFKDMESRIYSMALVHQKLYQSQNLSSIDLKEYIGELSDLLMDSFKVIPGRISLVQDLESVSVLIDTAIPCGLILNELISNALKHAFPGDRKGEVQVRLSRTDKGEIEMEVSDDGVGVPIGFDFKKDGKLGLVSVSTMGQHQLQGEVIFSSDRGFKCLTRFKDTLHRARV